METPRQRATKVERDKKWEGYLPSQLIGG